MLKRRTCLRMAGVAGIAFSLLFCGARSKGQATASPLVRLAELEIDPAQLTQYQTALKREIESSIRLEPGVLNLYAVSVKNQPNRIRIFEVYADTDAYRAHLTTPHFLRYKQETQKMIKSLNLIETDPIILGGAGKRSPSR